jgi:hypothetical protein
VKSCSGSGAVQGMLFFYYYKKRVAVYSKAWSHSVLLSGWFISSSQPLRLLSFRMNDFFLTQSAITDTDTDIADNNRQA